MNQCRHNAKWLTYFAPFKALSISAAYLTPFFLEKGLGLSEILALQSIFSLAILLWEMPSGILADRLGRARSIKVSAPIAAAAMLAYGLSNHYWQFVLCELGLAIASGLISGADTSLLYDSLRVENPDGSVLEEAFTRLSRRIEAIGFAATAIGVPVSFGLVMWAGISSTLVADGVLTLMGCWFVFRLVEAPRTAASQTVQPQSGWQATMTLARVADTRWLIVLGAVLSGSTYLAFWLSAPYYEELGIPVAWLGSILALRSLWKAGWSHWWRRNPCLQRSMWTYATLAGLVYIGMASGQWWLVWVVLGHDVVQALHRQPITARLNTRIDPEHRATVNSAVNLVTRLWFTIAGPLVGWLVDSTGLQTGLAITGITCSLLAYGALIRLRRTSALRPT